jgi:MerR family transcriptional regulator, copper efflux regulator
MSTTPPIACTITEAERGPQAERVAALRSAGLIAATRDAARAELRFRPDPEVRARVEAFVAVESRCCTFFAFDLHERGDGLVLTIVGPAESEPILAELVRAFS